MTSHIQSLCLDLVSLDSGASVLSGLGGSTGYISTTQAADSLQVTQALHISHSRENDSKRSDPFQFGSRYLQENDDVFKFNAWDHVETDDAFREYAEAQYAKQRETPVSDFDKSEWYIDILCSALNILMTFKKYNSSEVLLPLNRKRSLLSFAPI
jgi:hypothetical protein